MNLQFPPIYLLSKGFEKAEDQHELHRLEKKIGVVWDIHEAHLVLGKLERKTRAEHELRKLNLFTEDVDENIANNHKHSSASPRKKRKLHRVEANGEVICLDSDEDENQPETVDEMGLLGVQPSPVPKPLTEPGIIKVLRHVWYEDSLRAGELLPVEHYLIYEGRIIDPPAKPSPKKKATVLPSKGSISSPEMGNTPSQRNQGSFYRHRSQQPRYQGSPLNLASGQRAALARETTWEHDANFPPIPEYLHTRYCCQRPTPLHCPNEAFLSQLRIMKKGRELEGEEMRKRAYNSAIATVASYPYTITSPLEIKRLPNCGDKIVEAWRDWKMTGRIPEAVEFEASEKFKSLSLFCEIHDVAYKTAIEFWNKGWRDLDDVVEYGWDLLTRNQQIGVKYCDEFLQRIPRTEVEKIANIILQYANKIQEGFQMVICGGYRRGKADSGDVDVVLSHRDEAATDHFLPILLESLEADRYITHRLTHAMINSNRGQSTLSLRNPSTKSRRGFDTLDHAFVVWQDPFWPTKDEELKASPDAKNPNPHRRVDIIISPWKTAGCAVLGWSGGTMFERDLRHYCRKELGLKFDSSGVRDIATGKWMDLEAGAEDMLAKERKVFEGLKLEWRDPTERCTD